MAWTTPMTATDNAIWTSAQWNTHVRDNLLETMAGKATAASRWYVTTGTVNQIAEREITSATVATAQTTTSTSYADLTTDGPSVTVTTGTAAMVFWSARQESNTANTSCLTSVAVSGATTLAASDNYASITDGLDAANSMQAGSWYLFSALTAGSNTFKLRYRTGAGTATFAGREIIVMPL